MFTAPLSLSLLFHSLYLSCYMHNSDSPPTHNMQAIFHTVPKLLNDNLIYFILMGGNGHYIVCIINKRCLIFYDVFGWCRAKIEYIPHPPYTSISAESFCDVIKIQSKNKLSLRIVSMTIELYI